MPIQNISMAELTAGVVAQVTSSGKFPQFQRMYAGDRIAFAYDCLGHLGQSLAFYQEEILGFFDDGYTRVAVRGPHGVGKTFLSAILTHHSVLTANDDCKVITTASAWRQLEYYLWPEIKKMAKVIDWSVVGREPYDPNKELFQLKILLNGGTVEAFGVASDDYNTIEGAHAHMLAYILDEAKCLDIATPIPTPTGWTTLADIQVGDQVLDENGVACSVTEVKPIQYGKPCFRVTFEDGESLVADAEHLWSVLPHLRRQVLGQTHKNDPRYKKVYSPISDWRNHWDSASLIETKDLKVISHRLAAAIPTCRPLEFPDADLPIDPYTLGIWLGDGASAHGVFTKGKADAQQIVETIAQAGGFQVHQHKLKNRDAIDTYCLLGLQTKLRECGLLGNKHIPPQYLRASFNQRLALLRGLMDTDGTVMGAGKDSRVSITSVIKELALGIAELVRTFGWKVRVCERRAMLYGVDKGPCYILRWSADICPFLLKRKADLWQPRSAQASSSTIRTIRSMEPVESMPVRCIVVDSPRHLYLAGEGFIPTHNSIPRNTWNAAEGAFANSAAGKSGIDDAGELVAEGDGILDGLDTIRLPVYSKAERKRRADLPADSKDLVGWRQQIVRTPAEDHTLKLPVLEPVTMIDVHPSSETVAIIPDKAIAFAISTPGDPAGQFYDIHMHKPGYEDWLTKHVTVEDAIRAGRIDANWVRMRARQWGETSSLFLNRVLGEFADSSEDGIIPRSWVLMACERWKVWKAEGGILPPGRKVIGVDTARQGMDKTVCAVQQGFCIPVIYRYSKLSMTALAGYVKSVADGAHLNIEVDGGLGASLYDILHSEGVPSLHAITVGSSKVLWQDKSKKLKFFNVRAAMWWNMRELLDPDEGEGLMLPPNEDLILDLTAPRLKTMQRDSTILVESKADIRDRIGRSTDYGDSCCLSFWKMHTGGGIVV